MPTINIQDPPSMFEESKLGIPTSRYYEYRCDGSVHQVRESAGKKKKHDSPECTNGTKF